MKLENYQYLYIVLNGKRDKSKAKYHNNPKNYKSDESISYKVFEF